MCGGAYSQQDCVVHPKLQQGRSHGKCSCHTHKGTDTGKLLEMMGILLLCVVMVS